MKILSLAFFIFIAITRADAAANWTSIRKSGVLRVATEGSFRPFNYVEDKVLTGFEVELANAIAKKLGVRNQWSAHPFDSLLAGLSRHGYDLVAASHAVTPERAKAVEFISPHYCTGAVIVTRAGTRGTLKALSGHAIGVSVGTTYSDRLKAMPRFKEIKIFQDDAQAEQALVAGQIDAWVTDRFAASAMLKAKPASNLELGEVLFSEMVALAVAKGDTELKDKINTALATLMKDGTYQKLSQSYFNHDISCQALRRRGGSSRVSQ
ncbi:MAG: amino acid ABC transporter substrate-binding protein [Deltaproteobacteria bacterium]|nr:amino acid ABC transporter substrate-binding protein [Deltaproteobacteria bacterium]